MSGHLVIDTNVFVHGSVPASDFFGEAEQFLKAFIEGSLTIAIDPGFAIELSQNRSLLGSEYLKHVRPTLFGYQVLVQLLSFGRVIEQTLSTDAKTHKLVKSLVKGAKPRDRTLLRIACKSSRRELISYDFEDFQEAKRPAIKTLIGVIVCTAGEWIE